MAEVVVTSGLREPVESAIAFATLGDGSEIARVHYEAIRITAAQFYESNVIDVWMRYPDESAILLVKNAIATGDEIIVVARVEGKIVGFGSIIPAQFEFRSCYVSPYQGRKGIGSAIVQFLLAHAKERSLPYLETHSSLNAEAFYRKNGFTTKTRGTYRFPNGVQMQCAIMRKLL